jgi:L-lysine 2,3-aminomutase
MNSQHWLPVRCGLGYLWAGAPPSVEAFPDTPIGRRLAGLLRALHAWSAEQPAEPAPWLDVTVLDARCGGLSGLDVAALARLVEELRARDPAPLIRFEADWITPGWEAAPLVAAAEALDSPDAAPFGVHGIVDHLRALTPETERGLAELADRGVPLSAEIWLLRNVNDSIESPRELVQRLLHNRVRPYYLVEGEWLREEERAAPGAAEALVRGLRGWISGTGVPQWLRVGMSGERELVVPDHLRNLGAEEVTVSDYRGVARVYRNPPPAR